MNASRCVKLFGVVFTTIAIVTFLYAATDTDIVEINDNQTFDAFIKEHPKVVVEFYNPTCPVCNAFKKKGIYPETAKSLPQIKFVMTSSTVGEALHHKYGIQAFPTFVFFQDGQELAGTRFSGYSDNPHFTQQVGSMFNSENNRPTKKAKYE